MQLDKIYKGLAGLGIPVAYHNFMERQKPPYIIYFDKGGEARGADGENNILETTIIIELYSKGLDLECERRIKSLLGIWGVQYTWERAVIKEENLIQAYFEFDFIEKR